MKAKYFFCEKNEIVTIWQPPSEVPTGIPPIRNFCSFDIKDQEYKTGNGANVLHEKYINK